MGEVIQYSPTSSHRASERRNESSIGDKTEEVEEGRRGQVSHIVGE